MKSALVLPFNKILCFFCPAVNHGYQTSEKRQKARKSHAPRSKTSEDTIWHSLVTVSLAYFESLIAVVQPVPSHKKNYHLKRTLSEACQL